MVVGGFGSRNSMEVWAFELDLDTWKRIKKHRHDLLADTDFNSFLQTQSFSGRGRNAGSKSSALDCRLPHPRLCYRRGLANADPLSMLLQSYATKPHQS